MTKPQVDGMGPLNTAKGARNSADQFLMWGGETPWALFPIFDVDNRCQIIGDFVRRRVI
jgi:hypothetical protein